MKRNMFWGGLIAALTLCGAVTARAEEPLGRVSSVAGTATAQRPGEEPRSLACGDPVYDDDTLRTGPNSRVSVLLDDVMTHLAPNTQVKLGRTAQTMPSARLEAGQVRMTDPRDAGEPAQLAVLDADAAVAGNDAEGYLFREKVGPYAMLCEWDAPLPVTRKGETKSAAPGECVIAKPKEPLYIADAHDTRIPLAPPEECAPEVASRTGAPEHHLNPADVAAGPIAEVGSAGFGPFADAAMAYEPCDVSSCPRPIPLEVIEPDPVSVCGGPGVPCP